MISYVVSLAQRRIWAVKDDQDSFSFVDKTGLTVTTTDVKSNAEWNMEGSYKTERQKQLLRSEQFELLIVYGVGLPLMQPKLTSMLERLEKVPDLISRRTWPRP